MSGRIWLAAALLVAAVGCGKSNHNTAQVTAVQLKDLAVGEPIRHDNLSIFPVVSKSERNENPFITLDEGLQSGLIEIREMGSTGEGANQIGQTPSPFGGTAANDTAANDTAAHDTAASDTAANDSAPNDRAATASNSAAPTGEPRAETSDLPTPQTAGASSPTNPPEEPVAIPAQTVAPQPPANDDPFSDPANAQTAANSDNDNAIRQTTGGGSDVNRLLVLNRSNKPLYLMPGEIIVGGQQDRVIGTEIVIQPSDKPQAIDVFCVEHGRWHHRSAAELADNLAVQTWSTGGEETAAYPAADLIVPVAPEASSPEKAAAQAAQGKFIASAGNVSKASRLAVQEAGDQGQVWNEVAKENAKSGVAAQTATGAFTKNYADAETLKKLEPFMAKLKAPVADTENIVGVIVVVDGKIDSMDVFQSTPLFRQLWPKLLKSYALDAVNAEGAAGEENAAQRAECTKAQAQQFLTKAFQADETGTETKSNVAVTTRRAADVVSFSAGSAGMGGGMGGGFGGVHTSAFSK